jgi:hypothetical protein
MRLNETPGMRTDRKYLKQNQTLIAFRIWIWLDKNDLLDEKKGKDDR